MNFLKIDSIQEKIKMHETLNIQENTSEEILGLYVGSRSACSCDLDSFGSYCKGRGKDFDFTRSSNLETRR